MMLEHKLPLCTAKLLPGLLRYCTIRDDEQNNKGHTTTTTTTHFALRFLQSQLLRMHLGFTFSDNLAEECGGGPATGVLEGCLLHSLGWMLVGITLVTSVAHGASSACMAVVQTCAASCAKCFC